MSWISQWPNSVLNSYIPHSHTVLIVNIASDIVDIIDSDDEAGITLCVYVTIGGGGVWVCRYVCTLGQASQSSWRADQKAWSWPNTHLYIVTTTTTTTTTSYLIHFLCWPTALYVMFTLSSPLQPSWIKICHSGRLGREGATCVYYTCIIWALHLLNMSYVSHLSLLHVMDLSHVSH